MTKGVKIGIIVVVVVGLAVGGYFLYKKMSSDGKDPNDDSNDVQAPPPTPPPPLVEKPSYDPTPFTNQGQGDYFRLWVNRYYPSDAKSLDLSKSGKFDNDFIRKAWAKFGLLYKNQVSNWDKIKNNIPSSFAEKFDKKDSYNFQIEKDGNIRLLPKIKFKSLDGKGRFEFGGDGIIYVQGGGKAIQIGKWWDGGKQANIMVKGKPKNIKGSNFFDLAKQIDVLYKPDNFSSFSYRNRLDLENNFVD